MARDNRPEDNHRAQWKHTQEHYKKGTLQPIEVIEDWELGFCLGNAVKYINRCEHKGTKQQDLEKAIWYLERELSNCK